jgi:hypothetical protein
MNCSNCKAEWTPPAGVSITQCPFCGKSLFELNYNVKNAEPHEILLKIVQQYDKKKLGDTLLKGMLTDLMPHVEKKYQRIFKQALDDRIGAKLLDLEHEDNSIRIVKIKTLKDSFKNNNGFDQTADYVVDCFLFALGWIETASIEQYSMADIDKLGLVSQQIDFAFIDGVLQNEEAKALFSNARQLGFPENETADLINAKIKSLNLRPNPATPKSIKELKMIICSSDWHPDSFMKVGSSDYNLSESIKVTSALSPQFFNDPIVINSEERIFSNMYATNHYLFLSDTLHQSIHVIDLTIKSIVSSLKVRANTGRMKYANGKIFLNKDDYSVEMYDATNIKDIVYQQTLSGFNKGWLAFDKCDNNYFYWMEHWDMKIRIIDFSSGVMVVSSNPSTDGHPQGISRIGNSLYVSNAYQMSKKFDITDPTNPMSEDFGVQGARLSSTNNYILIDNWFGGHVTSIWNKDGNLLTSKTPSYPGIITENNLIFISESPTGPIKLFDISDGTFNNIVANSPRRIDDYNDNFWIALESNKVILYPR